MMLDGLMYAEIIAAMREESPDLNEDNLSNWKSGGYTEWLRSKERREDLLAVQEAIMERALKKGAGDLNKAALQMAVTKVFQLLDNLPPRAAELLKAELHDLGPVRVGDIASAQQQIVECASRLDDANLKY